MASLLADEALAGAAKLLLEFAIVRRSGSLIREGRGGGTDGGLRSFGNSDRARWLAHTRLSCLDCSQGLVIYATLLSKLLKRGSAIKVRDNSLLEGIRELAIEFVLQVVLCNLSFAREL